MKLEHGKRYLLKCGMITPPMRSRHGGISFDSDPTGGRESVMWWSPDGRLRDVFDGTTHPQFCDDLNVVCEISVDIQYKHCRITQHGQDLWYWEHEQFDGASDAFGTDENGDGVSDNRHGRCKTMMDCIEQINEMGAT